MIFECCLNEKKIIVDVGEIAQHASGSAVIRFGDTTVISTACCSKKNKNVDYFPLTVCYEEKMYADCKIPNVFNKREGKMSEHEILVSRLIDRSIRPMFCDDFFNELQIINVVTSYDHDSSPEIAALLGTSLAINISEVPFESPIAGVYIGRINGQFILNPNSKEKKNSNLNIFVSGNEHFINMIEADAKEIDENEIIKALEFGHEAIKKLCAFQKHIIEKIGKKKESFPRIQIDEKIQNEILKNDKNNILKAITIKNKIDSRNALIDIKQKIIDKYYRDNNFITDEEKNNFLLILNKTFETIISNEVRNMILKQKIRPDGRQTDEIRKLDSKINIFPKVHGSAMFSRGATQVISITTLATLDEKQSIDNLTNETERFFIHHYNFHPFSVCEISNIKLGRREVGHGKLVEKALKNIIPDINEFPFVIRVVSEVMSSNGSSSQASICASCLSLINAGVPIKNIISGISVGLITKKNFDINDNKNDYIFLADIQDLEDHYGDMDFKMACSKNGIVALQMDLKIKGITINMLREAIELAKKSCQKIRSNLEETLNNSKTTLINNNSLKVKIISVSPENIRDIIGINGKTINDIIEQCDKCKIVIKHNEKKIYIYHNDLNSINKAISLMEDIINKNINFKIGDKFLSTILRVEKFGLIVSLDKNVSALCHISQLENRRIDNIYDNYHEGEQIEVVITEIDEKNGKIKVSHKDI